MNAAEAKALTQTAKQQKEQERIAKKKREIEEDRKRMQILQAQWKTDGVAWKKLLDTIKHAAENGDCSIRINPYEGYPFVIQQLTELGFKARTEPSTATESYADHQGQAFRDVPSTVLIVTWSD